MEMRSYENKAKQKDRNKTNHSICKSYRKSKDETKRVYGSNLW